MSEILLLHSGGLDSTALGLRLKTKNKEFRSLYINFKPNLETMELKAVRATSGLLDVFLDIIDASSLSNAFVSSLLSPRDPSPNPGNNVIKLGTAMIYGIALPYAFNRSINEIYVGLTKLDADYSAEYRGDFLKHFSLLSSIAGYQKIEIKAPLLNTRKSDVLKSYTEEYQKVLKQTWSCIYNYDLHCGCCTGCQSRINAFNEANIDDPTRYINVP